MVNDVKVVITLTKAVPRLGFGIPLILAGVQAKAVPYTEVGTLEDVVKAGFEETTDVYKAAKLIFKQNNAPSKIALCASATTTVATLPTLLDEGWRQLIVVTAGDDGESTQAEIADYVEMCKKHIMYYTSVNPDTDASVIADLEGFERTFVVAYSSDDTEFPEAAVVGATAALDVGSFTYKNIILNGVTAQVYTATEVDNLHEQNVITILKKAGSIVTSEGITASGEYADIVDCKDYIIEQIEYQCQHLLNRVPKLPYDNRGIASLESVVVSVLMDAANNGMIAIKDDGSFDYSVNFGTRSQCDDQDISTRHYVEGTFTFALAGAIHTALIEGEIIA